MPTEVDPREERQARSLALEKAYVHDVYDQIAPHFTDTRYRAWPRVKQFLLELEPASLVADVGCGNGKYLDINPDNLTVGCDRCSALTEAAKARGHEVVTCDNLQLPFRDESFDAALSVAVIHHFATTERRVEAIRELARVLRIGGKVLITVWAMEQRHRKFDSQDVLVPWHEPVKSSSEDRASSVEREMTSTTTSDDDVLVYHAYSHISDSEAHKQASSTHHNTNNVSRKRQKYRNGRGRYRSAGSFDRCNGSRSSSELSSPNETCYSFVKRALQKLSSSGTTNSPHSSKRSNARPYFYRSCRKPWASASMEFGKDLQKDLNTNFPRNDLCQQSSLESECPDQPNADDVPIELRHLEGYESCMNCGSPVRETAGMNQCETNVCASCLPVDPDSGKKSRSLGDFLNMIPKLLRVKKCEKEPLGDLQKRISTASDPREYMVKSRGSNVNGIVRSKSTVSFMSRLEEIMSLSISSSDRNGDIRGSASSAKINNKLLKLPSLTSPTSVMVSDTGNNDPTTVILQDSRDCVSTNPRRYNSPADALRKLRQDVSLDEASFEAKPDNRHKLKGKDDAQSNDLASKNETVVSSEAGNENVTEKKPPSGEEAAESNQESHLASYYSMPELYKLLDDQIPNNSMFPTRHRQRHISFYEQAQTILGENEPSNTTNSTETRRHELTVSATGECSTCNQPQRGLVKRSLSVDTGDNASSHQCPRRFSASAAQGVLASALRTYCLPRSSSRGSSVKSDTSVDSEESIVSVIPRKGNSITSDTSVDSEESVVSIIQRSTSEIETLVRESGLRNNISRLGSRSARASPVTVLSSQTSSAESSPPQSGKNDGKFPGTGAVIDQLMQQHQQQMSIYCLDGVHLRHDAGEHILKMRRSLMRPVSDPKIEDRLLSNNSEENTGGHKPSTSRQGSGSNASSIESDDKVIKEEDEKSDTNSVRRESSENIQKPLETEKKKELPQMGTSGDLSRTPSPIGPFKYIDDPLLTGVAPLDFTSETLKSTSSYNEHVNSESEQCNIDACDTEQNSFADEACLDSPTSDPPSAETDKTSGLHETRNNEEKGGVNGGDSKPSTSSGGNEPNIPISSEEERYAKLRKLSQRIENLGLSSELLKSFYMSSEDNESPDTSPVSGGDPLSEKSCNIEDNSLNQESTSETCEQDTVLEKSDEESFIDESLKTVIQDNKRVVENSLETDCAIKEAGAENLSSSSFQQPNISHDVPFEYPKPHSSSSNEIKNNIRSGFKKRLIRSCITIDEVECRRDPISSEDTSPSSSTSLEWNDFDKMEAQEAAAAAAAATASGATSSATMTYFRRNSASAKNVEDVKITSPEDVNVADTENKYNVFLDKEICVFFETPSSSIGKSASSSSNATDFSTTSDRIRGAMQREKSDDRSSKESDSDNLSKLSDLEAKSDSAFSEDFARRTDLASSSSSASLDIIDTYGARTKMGGSESSWCDYDGPWVSSSSTKEKQPQQQPWMLDNIDEIPDDDKQCEDDVRCRGKNGNQEVEDWSQDKTMDFVKRRENFFSCAADCRDMYRISFDDSSPNNHNSSEVKEASAGEMPNNIPQEEEEAIAAESSAELQPAAKNSDDNEAAPTDILAAFVETISDLTSVFGELYPRHEGKFEDISSDDSIEISSFERILTSKEPQPSHEEQFGGKERSKNEDKGLSKDKVESSKAAKDGIRMTRTKTNSLSESTDTVSKGPCNSVPAKDELSKSQDSHKTTDNSPIKRNIQKQDSDDSSGLSDVPKFEKRSEGEVSKTPSKKKVEDLDLRKKIPDSFNASPKPKQFLQRSSQSVCTEKSRQDSTDKEEDSVPTTQSAPCSPRMKPRQRSVEEVLSRSKAELSRNSSLSQSTSQESLPGNENGGLMAYHRYYHVFRQGELDGLIDNYVENLHIISSYYDHANWCVVAEKVQVWTI